MKFLIDNYSSTYHTEPMYLNETLNLIEGCSSVIRYDDKMSIYDNFDLVGPDFFITHGNKMSMDILSYLKEHENIYLIVNISGLTQEQVKTLENILKLHEINQVVFFINYPNHGIIAKNINIFVLAHGADIFLTPTSNTVYNIKEGVFVNSKSQITKREGTYHYLSNTNSISKDVDIFLPTVYMSNLYRNYDKIVFKSFGKIIPQSYFDAIFNGNMVEYEPDSSNDPTISVLANIFEGCDTFAKMKQQVRNKHTCLHRTKSLLSQLPCNELVIKLGNIIGRTKWE
jgi:hypothetical protein